MLGNVVYGQCHFLHKVIRTNYCHAFTGSLHKFVFIMGPAKTYDAAVLRLLYSCICCSKLIGLFSSSRTTLIASHVIFCKYKLLWDFFTEYMLLNSWFILTKSPHR